MVRLELPEGHEIKRLQDNRHEEDIEVVMNLFERGALYTGIYEREEIEDVQQESFARTLSAIEKGIVPERISESWYFTLAKRVGINYKARDFYATRRISLSDEVIIYLSHKSPQMSQLQRAAMLEEATETLRAMELVAQKRPHMYDILRKVIFEGEPSSVVGKITSTPKRTMDTRLNRARHLIWELKPDKESKRRPPSKVGRKRL